MDQGAYDEPRGSEAHSGSGAAPPSISDAIARARAIAASLAAGGAGGAAGGAGGADAPAGGAMGGMPPSTAGLSGAEAAARIAAQLSAQIGLKRGAPMSGNPSGDKFRKKIYIPRDNHDINYMGLLLGPRGSHQKRMETESGARILIRGRGSQKDGEDEDDDLHVVVVAESEDALSRGVRMVEDILFDPDHARELKRQQLAALAESNGTGGGGSGPRTTNFGGLYGPGAGTSVEIMVATSIVGKIIGRGGETIRELQDRTGARIQVQKDTDVPPGVTERRVTVIGNDSDVARAKEEIMRIIQDREREMQAMSGGGGGGRRDGARGAASIQIQIPNQHVGLIIGRAGATVNALQVRTSTHIDIPSGPDMDNPGVRTTVISGPTLQACEAARAEIEGLIASDARGGFGGGGGGGYGAPPGPAVYIQVPDEAVGMVIGRGGENVRGLEMRTGTRIQIPHHPDPGSNPPVRTVMISGPPQACEAARQEIWQVSQMPPGSHWHGGPGGGGGGGGMPYGGGGGGAQPYPSQQAFDPYAGQYQQQQQQQQYQQPYQQQQQQPQQQYSTSQQTAESQPASGEAGAGVDEAERQRQWDEYYKQYYAAYGYEYDPVTRETRPMAGAAAPAADSGAPPPPAA